MEQGDETPLAEAAELARRHLASAESHDRRAERHEKNAALMEGDGDLLDARMLRRHAADERAAARAERERAAAYSKLVQSDPEALD
jgi:hypothetical protein